MTSSWFQRFQSSSSRSFIYIPYLFSVDFVISKLISQLPLHKIIIISLNQVQIQNPNVVYFNLGQINQTLFNTLFDSQPQPLFIIQATNILKQYHIPSQIGHIITFGTQFNSISDLIQTSKFLSNTNQSDAISFLFQHGYHIVSPIISSSYFNFTGIHITLNMTSKQYLKYLQQTNNYMKLQICNLLYPTDLQNLHDLPVIERPYITPDLLSINQGWINNNIDVRQISPKINWLINYFKINPGKHIIYTRFNESYGAQSISSFLQINQINNICITANNNSSDRILKWQQFNQTNNSPILISNVYPFDTLNDIKSLIIYEQSSNDDVLNTYLRYISKTNGQLSVIFLISVGPENQHTIEVDNYTQMAESMNQKDRILEKFSKQTSEFFIN